MGCTSSKLDDLPAVALCRQRYTFLDDAIRQRYALAEAHVAYIYSLKSIGLSLHNFFEQDFGSSGISPPSPKLNLPVQRKGDPVDKHVAASNSPQKVAKNHHSHSNSGSHLNLHSSDSDEDSLHHSDHSSPLHNYAGHIEYANSDQEIAPNPGLYPGSYPDSYQGSYPGSYPASFPGGFMQMNYMKNKATPSVVVYEQKPMSPEKGFMQMNYMKNKATPSVVVYEQKPMSPEKGFMQMNYMKNKATPSVMYEQKPMSPGTVHMGQASSSYYPYPSPNNNYNSYSYYGNPNYGGGGGMGGYGSPQPNYGSSLQEAGASSSSKPPPPPPSPPSSSAWDFFNPFESYDKYYPPYTPSRDSKELREEEGIPDLEDEDYHPEVVKEVHGKPKFVDGGGGNYSKSVVEDEDGKGVDGGEASHYQTRPSVSMENDGMEYEVHVVEKKIVDSEEKSEERGNAGGYKSHGFRNILEVVNEIKVQFDRASESGNEIAKMLEVGKHPYSRKHGAYQVSSKMLHVVTPSLSVVSSQPSTSKSAESSSSADKADPAILDAVEDVGIRSSNLSSTLQKLYLWEKKLYNEVKAEEKMRVMHDRKCRRLKRLDEKGAEAHKVESTRTLIRSLSTKIRIAIQVVDKISVTINKIRDEELWPQLNELIQGLTRMWKSMLECHRSQCHTIKEARSLDAMGSGKRLSDARLEATLQLERELINWTFRFSSWVGAQKGYITALNSWLLKCLLYEPEETPDGIVPFSPSRIGAPPIFVICNQWSQALDRISEREVVDSMRVFTMSVLQLWEQDKLEMRQRMMANKDMERKVKGLDREDQKLQKEIQAIDKKMVLISGDGGNLLVPGQLVYQGDTSNNSLQANLQRIIEAMESFSANSLKAYEELLQRSEEEKLAPEHEGVS